MAPRMRLETSRFVDPRQVPLLHRRLLSWYRRNRRELPWRGTRDPYRIWVSEVMLQQTQVATALPYHPSFLDRFPTVEHLAAARPHEVLAAWSGLGYYRRARHLHAAARAVVRRHGGRLPADEADFGALPGVGRYTRGAVLSIAFDRPLAVLDGNVARVLSRLFAVPAGIRAARGARTLWTLAQALVPMRLPGDWNQALMELGALVCIPRTPRCEVCPVASCCTALARGAVGRYPPPVSRPRTRREHRSVAVVRRRGRWLMTRVEGTLLEGMWEPPGVVVAAPNGEAHRSGAVGAGVVFAARRNGEARPSRAAGVGLTARAPRGLVSSLRRAGIRARLVPTGVRLRHRILDREIAVELWLGALEGSVPHGSGWRWVDPRDPQVPLTGLARKLIRAVHGAPAMNGAAARGGVDSGA